MTTGAEVYQQMSRSGGQPEYPLKTGRVGKRCTINLSRAETSSRWCGVVVRRGGASSGVVHVTSPWFKITGSVAKSPRVAKKYDVNIQSINQPNTTKLKVLDILNIQPGFYTYRSLQEADPGRIRKAKKAILQRIKEARIQNRQLKCRQEDDLADDSAIQVMVLVIS
ncbi:uncharacterized protein TNCV_881641 [Trichonephila clavipes]|nr:uncharacterized protein TNCV_881641 [Trichonephila clavipes]